MSLKTIRVTWSGFVNRFLPVLFLLGAGCAGITSQLEPPEAPQGPVTIRFGAVSESYFKEFQELAIQYESDHPDVTIEIVTNFSQEEMVSLETLSQETDCFERFAVIRPGPELGSTMALHPFLDWDAELSEDSFFDVALDMYQVDGALIGLPAAVEPKLLAYDKRLFDQAGLDYPQQGWTLDEFRNAAVDLPTKSADGQRAYGFVPDLTQTGMLVDFMLLNGVEIFAYHVSPARARFDKPDVIEAFEWYIDLIRQQGVGPNFVGDLSLDLSEQFDQRQELTVTGRAGIWTLGRDPFYAFGSPDMAHVGAVPFPKGINGKELIERTRGYHISGETDVAQPCWEWIKFLMKNEPLTEDLIPAHIDTAEAGLLQFSDGSELAKTRLEVVRNMEGGVGKPYNFFGDWLYVSIGFLDIALVDVMSNGVPAEEALQTAQQAFDDYRSCIIENDLLESTDPIQIFDNCIPNPDHPYLFWEPSVLRAPRERF